MDHIWGTDLDDVQLFKQFTNSALAITMGQRSLNIVTAFVTAEKLCRMVTMTTNSNYTEQQLVQILSPLQLFLKSTVFLTICATVPS